MTVGSPGTNAIALRPFERRVVRLQESGVGEAEIARRFHRSPEFIRRVIELTLLPGRTGPRVDGGALRPIERRVLHWRGLGLDAGDIAPRFRRSPGFIERVEGLARYKLDRI